jgi:LuxR family maltose regulon positive regulatory protein
LPQAGAALQEALVRAQASGERRPFLDEGPALVPLLRRPADEDSVKGLAAQLLAALAASPTRDTTGALPPAAGLPASPEPLSPQEQRVLRLLDAGLSNPEIAEELVVSVNTIKTHVQSIYRKLGVSSRREARAFLRRRSA